MEAVEEAITGGVDLPLRIPTGEDTKTEMRALQDQLDTMKSMMKELLQTKTAPAGNYQQRPRNSNPGLCYYCQGEHIKRNCPHLTQRPSQPNYPRQQQTTTYQYSTAEGAKEHQPTKQEQSWPTQEMETRQQQENFQGLAQ